MMNHEKYEDIIKNDTVLDLPSADAIRLLGELIDYCGDKALPKGCRRAIDLAHALLERPLGPEDRTVLNYFTANAWGSLHSCKTNEQRWAWEEEELASQILHLRRALLDEGFALVPAYRQCEILVNLGNLMSHVGRFVDALQYWQRAMEINSDFGMAVGNLGMGLFTYARCLHDTGHAALFLRRSYEELSRAVTLDLPSDAAREAFERRRQRIEEGAAKGVLKSTANWDGFSLGSSPDEVRYRKWSLDNVLFVNPLNDLVRRSIAACDALTVPSIAVSIGEGPYYAGFYDQMKQEYVSARFLLWEGITQEGVHFSDRGVKQYDTLDYPVYGLFAEKLGISFRMAYSILDKVAFFVNHYFDLGCPASKVSFRTIWYSAQKRKNGLRPDLSSKKNLPLRGLFWLSLDLFSDEPGFRDSIEPNGRDIHEIRRHLEHKYVKLHAEGWPGSVRGIGLDAPLAYSLALEDFQLKAMQLLHMVRSALIYLSLSVHVEETERARKRPKGVIVPGIPLTEWEDDWKTHP